MKNNSALFYTCSLIEFIGRMQKQPRSAVVDFLGKDTLLRISRFADVFHCEPIEKTADDFITLRQIPQGSFDNVAACRYTVPDYWTIGEVYERLIEDTAQEDTDAAIVDKLMEFYTSWIDTAISNYNSYFYYQSRDYIAECYREGKICA